MTKSAAPRKLNVKLLRKIQKHITEEPRRYNQNCVVTNNKADIRKVNGSVPPCGTMACIAGWASLLGATDKERDVHGHLYLAKRKLRLSSVQAPRLFSAIGSEYSGWPPSFAYAYRLATTPLTRAKIAVARIDHFIATKGAE